MYVQIDSERLSGRGPTRCPLDRCGGLSGWAFLTVAWGRAPTEAAVDALQVGDRGALPLVGTSIPGTREGAEVGGGADEDWNHRNGPAPEGSIPMLALAP